MLAEEAHRDPPRARAFLADEKRLVRQTLERNVPFPRERMVVAREDDEFAQREVLTVYSKAGDPLAQKK